MSRFLSRKMLLYSLILIFLTLFSSTTKAQHYNIDWLNGYGDEGASIHSIAIGASGNIYSAGGIFGTVDFDPGSGVMELSGGVQNGGAMEPTPFIYKTDPDGNPIWVKGFPWGRRAEVSIAVDDEDNSYITGIFRDSVDVDPGPGIYTLFAQNLGYGIFIVKLNANGEFIWGKVLADGDFFLPNQAIVLGSDNKIYIGLLHQDFVAGLTMTDTVDLDPNPGEALFQGNNSFVLKLDTAGSYVWAKPILDGNNSFFDRFSSYITGITLNNFGDIITTGMFSSPLDFDPGGGSAILTSNGDMDIFVSTMDSSGNFLWAKGFGGEFYDNSKSVAVDDVGGIYTLGTFGVPGDPNLSVSADFDPAIDVEYTLWGDDGLGTVYVSKLDAAGNFSWAKKWGGASADLGHGGIQIQKDKVYSTFSSLVVDENGTETLDMDPGDSVFNVTTTVPGALHHGLSVLDTAGSFVWGGIFAPVNGQTNLSGYERSSIQVDAAGDIYWGAPYYIFGAGPGTYDFDPGPDSIPIAYTGGVSSFLLKLSPCTISDTTIVSSCDSFVFHGRTYTQNGIYTDTITGVPGVCDGIFTLNLTLESSPETSVLQSGDTLTAVANDVNYQWINCGTGEAILGATMQNFTSPTAGTFAVIVSRGSCSDTSACYAIEGNVGIDDVVKEDDKMTIFPNPTRSGVTIQVLNRMKSATLHITNVNGQIVKELHFVNGKHIYVDMERLPAGLYWIEISENGKKLRGKAAKY